MNPSVEETRKAVRDRYARVAEQAGSGEGGCCEPACCGPESAAASAKEISASLGYAPEDLSSLPDTANLGLGCGNPTALASLEEGQTVLDLGSGAGIDCFLASAQVGPGGRVIGVDMTAGMIEAARRGAAEGGYGNVEFRLGEIEALPVADATVDVVISNCVLNLSTDKGRALGEAFRVLKPGGRIVVSDLVSDRPVPEVLQGNLDAVAACLPTLRAEYLDQFRGAGFADVRITSEKSYPASYILHDEGVKAHLTEHPGQEAELADFAGSIVGAHFEATKPGP